MAASATVASAQRCEFWVAPPPAGNNANPGTFAQPWATLQHAVNAIPDAGCTVGAKDGLYTGRQRMNRRFIAPATFRAVNPYRAVFEASETVITIFGGRNIMIEGLEIRHTASGASPLVIQVQQDAEWAEDIVFRNNVLHDSRDNDILKINNGARRVTVEATSSTTRPAATSTWTSTPSPTRSSRTTSSSTTSRAAGARTSTTPARSS